MAFLHHRNEHEIKNFWFRFDIVKWKEHRQWSQFVYILASLRDFAETNLFLNFFMYKIEENILG